jgi:hypothetical protein
MATEYVNSQMEATKTSALPENMTVYLPHRVLGNAPWYR